MTILSTIQAASTVLGIDVPDAIMASTTREHVELAALANEMAERIAKAHEWQLLNTIATYTGDGSTEDFSLPTDYDRMLKDAKVWSSSVEQPLSAIPDRDTWLGLDVQSVDLVFGAWIIYGGQMHIKTALASGATAKHWYQSNLIIAPASGDNKTAFTLDTDTFRLSERLLKLGIIWQHKANKGLPYAEHLETYEELKSKLISDDKGSRKIVIGSRRTARNVAPAYPFSVQP